MPSVKLDSVLPHRDAVEYELRAAQNPGQFVLGQVLEAEMQDAGSLHSHLLCDGHKARRTKSLLEINQIAGNIQGNDMFVFHLYFFFSKICVNLRNFGKVLVLLERIVRFDNNN